MPEIIDDLTRYIEQKPEQTNSSQCDAHVDKLVREMLGIGGSDGYAGCLPELGEKPIDKSIFTDAGGRVDRMALADISGGTIRGMESRTEELGGSDDNVEKAKELLRATISEIKTNPQDSDE